MRWRQNGLQLGDKVWEPGSFNRLLVVGAGKASAAMAREAEILLGDRIAGGMVVTKYKHGVGLQHIRCMEAGHPVPDDKSVMAGREIIRLLKEAAENDLVLTFISGGASALMVDCPPGVALADLQQVFNKMLQCGAGIQEMNVVRKHLSAGIKGGQLTRTAWPATVVSFILSDVIGDPLSSIASGPTVPDESTFTDAWNILRHYRLTEQLPASIIRWLQLGLNRQIEETPKPGDAVFSNSFNYLVGTNRIALEAAAAAARHLQYHTVIITDALQGEAREQAQEIVTQLLQYKGPRPACLLWGGETTVTIKGKGKGGRNQELALAALIALQNRLPAGEAMPVIVSAGTDGTDGPTDAAGAIASEAVIQMAHTLQLDAKAYLDNNDAWHFFNATGGLVVTGPTHTNVMDIVVALLK
jgi:hydroxypyruvate reductase